MQLKPITSLIAVLMNTVHKVMLCSHMPNRGEHAYKLELTCLCLLGTAEVHAPHAHIPETVF